MFQLHACIITGMHMPQKKYLKKDNKHFFLKKKKREKVKKETVTDPQTLLSSYLLWVLMRLVRMQANIM